MKKTEHQRCNGLPVTTLPNSSTKTLAGHRIFFRGTTLLPVASFVYSYRFGNSCNGESFIDLDLKIGKQASIALRFKPLFQHILGLQGKVIETILSKLGSGKQRGQDSVELSVFT